MSNRFVSTAIPFVNAEPHLGHALELILADALARFYRNNGDSVRFTTGTDENSLKSLQAATARGIAVQQLVKEHAAAFRRLADRLEISYDRFTRTSVDPEHRSTVEHLWEAIRPDLYRGHYVGLYCPGCEAFTSERDLINGQCAEHGTVPQQIEEENIFFRLSRHVGPLRELIGSGDLVIRPNRVRDEVLATLDAGLPDLSVSRPRRAAGWGLPVPGDPGQVIYVWFDALANYLTGAGNRWTLSHRTHVIGKGIARFHAIYWPSFLLSARLPLPHEILVHGYLTVDGHKISKSLGNAIDPHVLLDRYGVDAIRWFVLRHVHSTEDADFSQRRLDDVYQSELAHGLGNLVGRVIGLCQRLNIDGEGNPIDHELQARVRAAVAKFALHEATTAIWAVVDRTNGLLQKRAPWTLLRQPNGRAEAGAVVRSAVASVRAVASALVPFLPETANAIASRLDRLETGSPLFEDLRH